MRKKLKVGLIGLGGICRAVHAPSYLTMDNVEIAAVCDIIPEKIESFKKEFNMNNVASFTDYKELLDFEGLDFIDICTPN